MDDNMFNLLALIVTIIVAGTGASIWYRLRSFIKNLAELLLALEKCMDEDCTTIEVKEIVKELKETTADGLGFWSALLTVFKR